MIAKRTVWLAGLLAFLVSGTLPRAAMAEAIRFPEATHKQGELKYIDGVAVLFLSGTPEEIGEQHGKLLAEPLRPLLKFPKAILARRRSEAAWPIVVAASNLLLTQVPPDHRAELQSAIRASGLDAAAIRVANTMLELRRLGGCSTLIVEKDRSATGRLLFGRNFDFPPMGILDKYSLVTVVRPKGKHAFVSVGFPSLVGVISGMNDAGLAVATLDVYRSKDGSPMFDPAGVPMTFTFRRILEECTTVAEAEKLLRSTKATTWMNLAVCDKETSAVFELTPKTVGVRSAMDGLLPCTNHFRCDELCVSKESRRYKALEGSSRFEKLGVKELARMLHAANQGPWTIQTMIFEPERLKLHLALGEGPTSAKPMKTLDVAALLKRDRITEPAGASAEPAEKRARPRLPITISKETTQITEPLRKDGYPDYLAALNEHCRGGVTVENNAAIPFWRAFGPAEIPVHARDRFFKMLGIPALPEKGDYLVSLVEYAKRTDAALDPDAPLPEEMHEALMGAYSAATGRPWSRMEFPTVAGWLEANEKPLRLLVAATRRPRMYTPIVPSGDPDSPAILTQSLFMPGYQQAREVARILTARAMLRLDAGQVEQAWQDILALHRWARLVGQGPFLIDELVGIAIESIACEADRLVVDHPKLTPRQARRFADDLGKLPPMPRCADKIALGERYLGLDLISGLVRGKANCMDLLGDFDEGSGPVKSWIAQWGASLFFNWDEALRTGNAWYDRFVSIARQPTRAQRMARIARLEAQTSWGRKPHAAAAIGALVGILGQPIRTVTARQFVGTLVSLSTPAIAQTFEAEDRAVTRLALSRIAFALAAYRGETGRYPEQLSQLTPEYLPSIPKDIFSGRDLHFKRDGDGYRLYSVGSNGQDDGGKSYGDGPPNDDLRIRTPSDEPVDH